MLSLFQQYLLKKNIISSQHRILCAVSGGVDSMVLVDLLLRSKYKIGVVHMNHKTRNGESDLDENFVREFCETNCIPFYCSSLPKHFATLSNFQELARIERYKFFYRVMEEEGFDFIATAHHQDDDVENFFINLFRGAGMKGLGGIPFINDVIIRPLKYATKNQILTYKKEKNISFVEDKTNNEDSYLRNKIRLSLIPELLKIDKKSIIGVKKSILHLSSSHKVLTELIMDKYITWYNPESFYIQKRDLPVDEREILTILHYCFYGRGFNEFQILDLIRSKRNNSYIITDSHKVINENDNYVLIPAKPASINLTILGFGTYKLDDGRIIDISPGLNENDYWFETDPFPIIIRSRKTGDKFQPLGMNGKSKTIKKYIVDAKISSYHKTKILLLEVFGTIAGLLEYRKSVFTEKSSKRTFGLKIKLISPF